MKNFIAVITAGAIIAGGGVAAYAAAPSVAHVFSHKQAAGQESQVAASSDLSEVSQEQIDALMNHPLLNAKPYENMDLGPNKALIVHDGDWADMVKNMNKRGEWMNEAAIIGYMHSMANTKVARPDESSPIEITDKLLTVLIENVKKAPNIEDRDAYLTLLNRWKAGNFDLIEDDFNYLKVRGDVKQTNKYKEAQKPDLSLLRAINDAVGVREPLSDERKEAAAAEWVAGEDDLSDLEKNPPKTLDALLAEIEKMYQGETKFTEKRIKALAAIKEKNKTLRAQYYKNVFTFPAAPNVNSIANSYETFHQYIDKIVKPLTK